MDYKETLRVPYPPFSFFAIFIRDLPKMKNDPSFLYESQPQGKPNAASSNSEKSVSKRNSQQVKVTKTETKPPNAPNNQEKTSRYCLFYLYTLAISPSLGGSRQHKRTKTMGTPLHSSSNDERPSRVWMALLEQHSPSSPVFHNLRRFTDAISPTTGLPL